MAGSELYLMGKRLQSIRTQRGLSRPELAKCCGLTTVQVANAEKGRAVSLDVIIALVKYLDVSMDYIVLGIRPQHCPWGLILHSDDELEAFIASSEENEEEQRP